MVTWLEHDQPSLRLFEESKILVLQCLLPRCLLHMLSQYHCLQVYFLDSVKYLRSCLGSNFMSKILTKSSLELESSSSIFLTLAMLSRGTLLTLSTTNELKQKLKDKGGNQYE